MLRLRIQPLTTDQVLVYLKLLATVAAADGDVEDAERLMFEAAMSEYGLPEHARNLVRGCLDRPPGIDAELRRIDDAAVRRLFLRDAFLMAYADCRITEAERAAIEEIRVALRLSEDDARASEAWVREGVAWLERGDEMVGTMGPHRRSMF